MGYRSVRRRALSLACLSPQGWTGRCRTIRCGAAARRRWRCSCAIGALAAAASTDRRHRHQSPQRGRITRAQARRTDAALVAHGTPDYRREHARGSSHRGDRQQDRWRADAARFAVADPSGRADRVGHRRRRLRWPRLPGRHLDAGRRGARHRARTIGAEGSPPPRRNTKQWKKTVEAPAVATRTCALRSALGGRSGAGGPDTTAEAASRRG